MNDNTLFKQYLEESKRSLINQYKYNENTGEYETPAATSYRIKQNVDNAISSSTNNESSNNDDYIPSVEDNWRQANKNRAQVRLSEAQNNLSQTEATWLPQVQTAFDYVEAAMNYKQLSSQDVTKLNDDQINKIETLKYNLLNKINQLEPIVKEQARTNPYLQNIFYETSLVDAIRNNDVNAGRASIASTLVDLDNRRLIDDVNPLNNFQHLIERGPSDRIDALSQQDFNNMWNRKIDLNDLSKLQKRYQDVTDALDDAKTSYNAKLQKVVERTNIVNKGSWLFDPTKIDPRAQEAYQNNDISISDPNSWWKAIPELGSSYANLETMAAQIVTNAAISRLAGAALTVGSGGTLAPLLLGASEFGIQYGLTKMGREKETASEMFDNYQQRVTEEIQRGNIDYSSIQNYIDNSLESLGFDVESMDDQQKFGAMLSSGINTGNANIDQIIDESRKGLDVVEQTNNALMLSDLIEAGMYMYGGRYVKDISKLNASKSTIAGDRMASSILNRTDETLGQLSNPSLYNRAKQMLTNKLVNAATLGSKNQIKKNSARRIIENVGDYTKKSLATTYLEGREEGQQYLVGKEYSQGKYDNVENYDLLDGLVNSFRLGFEARAAYYGLHTDDALNTDQELKKNMDVGGFTGFVLGTAYTAPNIYSGIRQLNTDRKLQELAANGYANAENDEKISAFLRAANNNSSSLTRIHNTLEQLRANKPEGVTDKMIDADKELASKVWTLNRANVTKNNTTDLKIDKKSDTYRRYINNALLWSDKENDQRSATERSLDELVSLQQEVLNYKEGQNDVLDAAINKIKEDYIRESQIKSFENYKEGKTADVQTVENISTEQILNEALRFILIETLHDLNNQLGSREQDLKRLLSDKKTDVNIENISAIKNYIDNIFKQLSKDKVYKGLEDVAQAIPNYSELREAIAASQINSAVLNDLVQHKSAYTTGFYSGDTSLIKPVWNNLTEAQKQEIIDSKVQEAINSGKPQPNKKQIISDYNNEINEQWDKDDESPNKEKIAHKRALSIIQRDLLRRQQLENIAEQELQEKGSNSVENPNIDEVVSQTEGNEETVASTEPTDTSISENDQVISTPTQDNEVDEQSEIDKLQNQLNGSNYTPPMDSQELQSDDSIEMPPLDNKEEVTTPQQDDSTESRIEDLQNDKVEEQYNISTEDLQNPPVEINEQIDQDQSVKNTAEDIDDGKKIDLTSSIDADNNNLDINQIPEETTTQEQTNPVTQDTNSDDVPIQTENKTIDVVDTGSLANKPGDNPDIFVADANQVIVINDQIGISPNGTEEEFVSLDPQMIAHHATFEDVFNQNGLVHATDIQQQDQYIEKTRGLSNDKKQKKNLINNTFFFQPSATTPITLKANGEEVSFITKDGKIAKRGTGKELSDKLEQPGWLQTADDVYYIVTDAWKDDRRVSNSKTIDSAVNNAAIHMVIEKDGVVYTTSLRTPQRAEYELRELGVNRQNIDNELEALSLFRKQIIQTYAPNYINGEPLPSTPRKDCKPINLRISNGTINNIKQNEQPVFRKLTEVSDLNLSSDPYTLTNMIEEGELEIGYGKGAFCLQDPFAIVKLSNTEELTSSQAIGYAGKLYVIPKVNQTPSQRVSVPIMLTEEKHWIPGVTRPEDIKLTYDNKHQAVNLNNKPSTAELIYELMTKGLFSNQELNDFFLSLLARTGERTIPHFSSPTANVQFYVRKALNVTVDKKNKTVFQIGTANIDDISLQKNYAIRNIVLDNISESMRRRVIFNISRNIHWNTDKDLMMSRIPDSVAQYVLKIAKSEYIDAGKTLTKDTDIEILGPDVAFTLSDIGYTIDDNNNIVKIEGEKEAPSVIAWMINHGKIKIDTGEHLFKAPFVFADGVTRSDISTSTEYEQKSSAETENTVSTEDQKSKEEKEQSVQKVEDTPKKSSNKKTITKTVVVDGVKQEVTEEINPEWEQNIGKKPDLVTDENLSKYKLQKPTRAPQLGSRYVIFFSPKTGKPSIIQMNVKDYLKNFGLKRYKQKGWYSTEKDNGKLKEQKARKWLNDKLGLTDEDVFITNSVLRTHSNEKAYGVMRVVWDYFKKEFNPQIVISKHGGKGVTYHEAWHYVSQLLLTENQRSALYQDYIKRHKKAEDYTKEQIEEAMAEEFKDYMVGLKSIFKSYHIIKFFDRLGKLLKLDFLRPGLHTQMYAKINKGDFAKYKPSQSVLNEFNQAYDSGLHFYIPGMSEEEYSKIPNISDGQMFYDIVRSLVGSALSYMQVRTQRELQKGLNIDSVFNNLEQLYNGDSINPDYQDIALDVLGNRELFSKYIKEYLQDLGIDKEISDTKNAESDDEQRQKREIGDMPDNTWDAEQGEHSKKDKLAFNARLFFYSIPEYQFETVEYEDGKIIRIPTPVTDPIFNLNQSVPFSIAWNKVMENLWDIDTFDEMVERCDRLSAVDPFFYALKERLTDTDNQLTQWEKTQLEVAIKSSKNSMTTIKIHPDKPDYKGEKDPQIRMQLEEEAKKRSIWGVEDSSNLTKIARYPRQWSLAFFSSDNTQLDGNRRTVNPLLVKQIKTYENNINNILKEISKKDVDQIDLLDNIKDNFIQLMNLLYIPMDSPTFDYMLNCIKSTDKDGKFINDLQKFKNLWKSNKSYSIGSILTNIKNYQENPKKANIPLNRIFTVPPYATDTFIGLVAVSYGNVHPSPEEFSVTGADGSLRYPISENNYMSDQIRWLNKNMYDKASNILNSKYGASSILARNAGKIKFKLHTLIAVEEKESQTSRDYFGISPIEDYITKLCLTNADQMTLPTMSDKKTWYSISGYNLLHETLSRVNTVEQRVNGVIQQVSTIGERRFSSDAINIFSDYFESELNAVIDYFNKKDFVAAHPELWRKNYHGKIKNGKILPGGNGGRFRYFTRIQYDGKVIDLNQQLSKLENLGNDLAVKLYLDNLKEQLFKNNKSNLSDAINNYLIDLTNREVDKLINMNIVYRDGMSLLHNKLIPANIISEYYTRFKPINAAGYSSLNKTDDILYSIIGSHVANTAISIQEVEKCFTGDPAYYKWQSVSTIYKPNDDSFQPVIYKDGLNKYIEDNPGINPEDYAEFSTITGMDVDKIKRLSSVLSTGSDMRLNWGDGDERNDTKYTVLNLSDNQVSIPFYEQLLNINKLSLIRDEYESLHPELSVDEIYSTINMDTMNDIIKQFDESTQQRINKMSKLAAAPYKDGEINQSDAAVYMRPAMWRRLMMAQGRWNDQIEKAYRIIENNDNWMNDTTLYNLAKPLILNVQKMVYMGDTFDKQLGLDIPVFNKMAIFPMFKSLCKADNKLIYDRMNNEDLGVIDMLVFESAVKVGLGNTFKMYKDEQNTQLNIEALNKPSYAKTGKVGDLPTLVQDIKHLRLQLNTDPHEHMDRSMGTQAVKMFLSNLRDDLTYGLNKGKKVKGSDIKQTIMSCIDRLTEFGVKDIHRQFFKKENGKWVIDNQKLSNELIKEAKSSGMSEEVINALQLDQNGNFNISVSAMSSRNWIESRIISLVNKTVVDINTKGGAAIQMSNFGFKKTTTIEYNPNDMSPLNNGNSLKFLRNNGSMEVMLSTNFFRHIVPKEKQANFKMMRDWLFENNIIGENSQPIGIGYRIPTQGSSSTFAFTVMDVLPETYADTIVVPDGFTAMTGSDFDVDKLYIATYDFENGKKVEYDENVDFYKQSKEAITNRMLEYQMMCISDENNMAETKASIDTLTSFLKKDVLKLVMPSVLAEAKPGYALLPSFQLSRKIEYTSGKAGIAPFALNSTNHALTQFAHLCMSYSNGNRYNLGNLDAIKGQDGFRILDWLSAMINAHVDVAKDPYIIALNVNQITYNMTNLLLRGGKGQSTFYFLAQDILKMYAAEQIANRGVYGVDPTITEAKVINKYYQRYEKVLYDAINIMPDGSEKQKYIKLYNGWLRERLYSKMKPIGQMNDANITNIQYDWVFDESKLKNALKASKTSAEYAYQQLIVMKAYKELNSDAKRLAKLVKISQIDTKKYGNNLAVQMNFKNMVSTFSKENEDVFYINDNKAVLRENQTPIEYYMQVTFLGKKLYYGLTLPRTILRKQSIVATKEYEDIHTNVMRTFVGPSEDDSQYQYTNDQEYVVQINKALESVIRARIAANNPNFNINGDKLYDMFVGPDTMCRRLTAIKRYILEEKDNYPTLVDKNTGTIKNALLNYLQEYSADGTKTMLDKVILSNSSMNNDKYTENVLISAFDDLLNHEDEFIRDFAEDLAMYAYFSTYDNNSVNNFFNLVPVSWKIKKGYTTEFRKALEDFGDVNSVAGQMVAESIDDPKSGYYPSISTTIARNMWYNKEIVKPYKYDNNSDMTLFIAPDGSRKRVLFMTKNAKDRYINVNGELYRKVGEIMLNRADDESQIRSSLRSVYLLTPKLGVEDNGTRIFEYVNGSTQVSAFPQNNITSAALIDGLQIQESIRLQNDNIVDKIMNISGKNRVNDVKDDVKNYILNYNIIDDVLIDAVEAKEQGQTYVDPGYDEYSSIDTSMITDYTGFVDVQDMSPESIEVFSTGDATNNMTENIPEVLQNEADIFTDMSALIENAVKQVNTVDTGDLNISNPIDDSFLNDMNALGEIVKNKCKGK